MAKIKIVYPQIFFSSEDVECTDSMREYLLNYASSEEKAKFIWNKMSEIAKENTFGEKMIQSFIDSNLSDCIDENRL